LNKAIEIKRRGERKTASNERFGASGAVPRPKGSTDFEVLCLVSSVVKAPPSPSRQHVICNRTSDSAVIDESL